MIDFSNLPAKDKIYYQDNTTAIYCADCREILPSIRGISAVVTDPPYELGFMGKEWDKQGISFQADTWRLIREACLPGATLLSFGGTRTYHRMVCAIEDAGFEVRDCIMWVYGCLSEDTEILTINGWERYHRYIALNPVLCYNIDRGSFEFHKPTRDFIYENKHTAYRIQSDKTDQIVSRNHRVLVERGGKQVFCRAEELQPEENIPFLESLSDLPETIPCGYEGAIVTKQDLLQRVCDNSHPKATTSQANGRTPNDANPVCCLWQGSMETELVAQKDKDPNLLNTLQRDYTREGMGEACTQRSVSVDNRKLCQLSGKDEWGKQPSMEGGSNLFQKARQLLTDKIYQMSSRILGYGSEGRLCYGASLVYGSISGQTAIENRSSASYQPQSPRQSLEQSPIVFKQSTPQTTRSTITPIEYHGKVWCVEVPTGAFVARRNGKMFITGNSGFPKSLNIAKKIDQMLGNTREVAGRYSSPEAKTRVNTVSSSGPFHGEQLADAVLTKGTSEWEGYGTGLKPAYESIVLARKPISEKTIAENCLKWGVGGLNIEATRIYANSSYRDDGNNESKDLSHKLSQLYDTLCTLEPFSQVARRDYRQASSDIGYVRKVYKELGSQFYCPACRRLYDALLPIFRENDLDIFALLPSVLVDIDHLRKEPSDNHCCLSIDPLSNLDAVHQLILSYHTSYNNYTTPDIKSQTQGRFPSNFIHDGSQEVMELFPDSRGMSSGGSGRRDNSMFGVGGISKPEHLRGDSGSAARYFKVCPPDNIAKRLVYCAKASKKERNMGLEDMEEKRLSRRSEEVLLRSNYVSTEQMFAIGDYIRSRMEIMGITLEYLNEHFNYVAGCNWWLSKNPNNLRVINPTDYKRLKEILQLDNRYDNLLLSNLYTEPKSIVDRPQSKAKNNHPTVKPLALMTYLCKLVKMPKYNLILDPFCGSGTTLLACKKLGVKAIGIDSNEEYCRIAVKRLCNQ